MNAHSKPTFVIEKGIPIPPSRGPRRFKYPFAAMEVGDSFASLDSKNRITSAVCYFAKRHPGMKFTTRRIGAETRVWRIA